MAPPARRVAPARKGGGEVVNPPADQVLGVCVLCTLVMTKANSVNVTKGLPAVVQASRDRREYERTHAFQGMTSVRLHKRCRKDYTNTRRLDLIKRGFEAEDAAERQQLRSVPANGYSPQNTCLFCLKSIDFKNWKRLPEHRRMKPKMRIHCVESVTLERNVKAAIKKRQRALGPLDKWALEVDSRAAGLAYDFCAAEVKYHAQCYLYFSTNMNLAGASAIPRGRPVGTGAFNKMLNNLYESLEKSEECQFSMSELDEMIRQNGDERECSQKWLKTKLIDYFGRENVIITKGRKGKDSVLNFSGRVGDVLQNHWYKERIESPMDEKERVVTLAAKFIREEINKTYCPKDEYPSFDDLAQEDTTTGLLKLLLKNLITTKIEDKTKVNRKQQFIGQCIMLATRPRSFISPLLLALASSLHRAFGSKQLIKSLNSLGACHSYGEVKRFVFSLTHDASQRAREAAEAPGVAPPEDGFVQWVFDNADWLTATLDGHNTFHCLGGAEITTPARTPPRINVPRLPLPSTAEEIAACGHFIPKKDYDTPQVDGLARVIMRVPSAPSAATAAAILGACRLDALHLVGLWEGLPTTPSWTGFMKTAMVCDGVSSFAVSSVEPTPFVNQDPTDPETLYSALQYAYGECTRRQQKGCFVTFDNGLFPKAARIVASDLVLRQKVVVRLGGFHSLMSFMGAIGHVMSGSGLDDLWDEIYAHNSVVHMMSGKAYARALRAHFLTQEAVAVMLLDSSTLEAEEKDEMCALHAAFLAGETTSSEAAGAAATLWNSLEEAGERAAQTSLTGRLWWQYYKLVGLMRLFIRAERTGDWDLHLATTTAMEPLYYSAGHHLYARSTRLYVQTMEDLDGDLAAAARKGYFTVRRNSQYWAGVCTDMVVEQDIMRIFKEQGGPVIRGLTDSTLAQWVGTMPAMHKVSTALEKFCGVQRVTSEQHVDLRESRVSRDHADRGTLLRWLRAHNPFDISDGIRCLSTGVMGSEKVNCFKAITLGTEAMSKLAGTNFKDLTISREYRVVPLSETGALRKKKAAIGESNALFVSMCCLGVSPAKFREYVKYELCKAPPALFEDGMMRHNTKSALIQCLVPAPAAPSPPLEVDSNGPPAAPQEPTVTPRVTATRVAAARRPDGAAVTVVDGGYLLHLVGWPRPGKKGARGTYGDVCRGYVCYTDKFLRAHGPVKVVFDGYNVQWSTKCEEQRRRALKSGATIAPDIDVSADLVCRVQREQFLGNTQNKARLITMLRQYLEAAAVHVQQAEADADVLIVETALAEAAASRRVRVVATDTDILAVLIARAPDDADITVVHARTKRTPADQDKTYDIASLRAFLGDMVHCVLPVHALTGCDTTAAIYGKGKSKLWNLVRDDENLKEAARVFNQPEHLLGRDRETLIASGERLMLELYCKGASAKGKDLNDQRYYNLNEMATDVKKRQKLTSIDLRTVPFTSDAGVQKTLRSYLQVQQWLGKRMNPTEWGWTVRGDDMSLSPLPMSQHYAPEDLLVTVSCGCKTGCKVGSNCSCRKNKTHCSAACRNCRGEEAQGCTNTLEGGEDGDSFGEG